MNTKLIFFKIAIIIFFLTGCGFKVVNQSELLNFNIFDLILSIKLDFFFSF